MADSKQPGQFGTKAGADPSEAGKKGAQAQPTEAKRRGGQRGGSASSPGPGSSSS